MQDKCFRYTFSLLGGDQRQAAIAERLVSVGYAVKMLSPEYPVGTLVGTEICKDILSACEESDFLILPLPVTRDGTKLNDSDTELEEIIRIAKKNEVRAILGGKIPDTFVKSCADKGIPVFDYYLSEELQVKNALPSAEGALMLAMEHTKITVRGMRALVCGYGRIGKLLSDLLVKMGAEVKVAARSDEALFSAASKGMGTARLTVGCAPRELEDAVSDCDVIFNTVPHRIFSQRDLCGAKKGALYIEIASNPGGVDVATARGAGIRFINAPSIPGKYAPESAGKYIFETVLDILAEEKLISSDR